MQTTLEFSKQQVSPDKFVLSCSTGSEQFRATVMLNANDSMVFAHVTHLPESRDRRIEALSAFKDLLYSQYGAKTFTQIDPQYFKDCVAAGFNPKPFIGPANREINNALMISRANLDAAVAKLSGVKKEGLKLLLNHDLRGRGAELFEFKKSNADFVTPAKIEGGLYSADAEEKKLHNKNNMVFALVDDANKIVACLMLSVHGNWAYGADFIVDKAQQQHGIGKFLCLAAHQHLAADIPNINAWLIGGGHEEDKLYEDLFGAQPINAKAQEDQGLFLFFTQPGNELKAAIAEKASQRYTLTSPGVATKIGFMPSPRSEAKISDGPAVATTDTIDLGSGIHNNL